MPGTRNTKNVLDLDALLAQRVLKPRPVKLGGKTYQVRTDLTGTEVLKCYELIDQKEDTEALRLLVGDDADELKAALDNLPHEHMNLVVREVMIAAGVMNGESEGESLAS